MTWDAERLDVTKVTLEAFARACAGKEKFLIPLEEMVHGASVTEAIIRSAETHLPEKVVLILAGAGGRSVRLAPR